MIRTTLSETFGARSLWTARSLNNLPIDFLWNRSLKRHFLASVSSAIPSLEVGWILRPIDAGQMENQARIKQFVPEAAAESFRPTRSHTPFA
jgi:hypothetical protein